MSVPISRDQGGLMNQIDASLMVDFTIAKINDMRLRHPTRLSRIIFSFPRVLMDGSDHWIGSAPLVAAATGIARNPTKSVTQPPPIKKIGYAHPIPSMIIRFNGVRDAEYHVSRQSMERLLSVGCIAIQRDRNGFFARIPYSSPAYHGKPQNFGINQEPPLTE